MNSSVLPIGHRPRGQLEVLEVDPVPRTFVVEAEPAPLVADRLQPAAERPPLASVARVPVPRPRRVRAIGRPQRVLRQRVLDIGDDQFLMLLLVIEPQLDDRRDLREAASIGRREEVRDRRIDRRAIGVDLRQARAASSGPARDAGGDDRPHCSKN